jgi:hypothetical protein
MDAIITVAYIVALLPTAMGAAVRAAMDFSLYIAFSGKVAGDAMGFDLTC